MKKILFMSFIWFGFIFNLLAQEPGRLSSDIIKKARHECESFNSGEFSSTQNSVVLLDITGDGHAEEIVDASQFSCSTALTLWGGTGGTFLWVIADQKIYEFLAHKWEVVDVDGQKVFLLAVHTSECGDKIGPCYRAYVWSDGFRTTQK